MSGSALCACWVCLRRVHQHAAMLGVLPSDVAAVCEV